MVRVTGFILTFVLAGFAAVPTPAATVDLSQWFLRATANDVPGTAMGIAAPDFLLGSSMRGVDQRTCISKSSGPAPIIYQTWQLLEYDRKHHIALAMLHTDGNGIALFKAPAPSVNVPDNDLSRCSTGRGVAIGSSYAEVLAVYGPPVKHGRHFVTSYSAGVPDVTTYLPHRRILDAERITLVIDDGYVSSILIYIQCCNG